MGSRRKAIGAHLASARKALGHTQAVVAAACGLTAQRLGRIENGRAVLLFNEAILLTKYLGLSLDHLGKATPPKQKGGSTIS